MEKTFSFRTETSASVEVDQHNKLLNELGADGWELMPMVLPQCNIPNSFDEIEVEVVLRRRLAE